MLVLDANLWISAFDTSDRFHEESVALFHAAARRSFLLAGPAFVVLESVCALRRRIGDPQAARLAASKIIDHPALHLEPITSDLLAEAQRLGIHRSLRGTDALYAATAARLRCPLLTWDNELIDRAGGISPRDWLANNGHCAEAKQRESPRDAPLTQPAEDRKLALPSHRNLLQRRMHLHLLRHPSVLLLAVLLVRLRPRTNGFLASTGTYAVS